MSIGSILLGLALLVLVALYVFQPLLVARSPRRRRMGRRQALLVQKEALLAEIRLLDFDFETSKLLEADYEQQRAQLMSEAVAIYKALDALEGEQPDEEAPVAAKATARRAVNLNGEIEAAVSRLRGGQQAAPAKASASGTVGFCPECGQPADANDKFCSRCGHKLSRLQPV